MRKTCTRSTGLIFLILFFQICVIPLWAEKERLVQTQWKLSDGIQAGEEIYFLSHYSLYVPGKVIIPLFIVTPEKYFFTDLSLYRVNAGGSSETSPTLARVWIFGQETSNMQVDLQSCRYGRDGDKLYFSWRGDWDGGKERSLRPTLEYDVRTGAVQLFADEKSPVETMFKITAGVAAAQVKLHAGILPLSDWGLPSPLEYSSMGPPFLQKILVRSLGDRELRIAALTALDEMQEPALLREILRSMETRNAKTSDLTYEKYHEEWSAKIEMSDTLRLDRPETIFSAAYGNDAPLLKKLIEAGASPDSRDGEGRTALMYAVFGNAPDALSLLFEKGADPGAESGIGTTAWYYAANSPLRPLYLKLWGK